MTAHSPLNETVEIHVTSAYLVVTYLELKTDHTQKMLVYRFSIEKWIPYPGDNTMLLHKHRKLTMEKLNASCLS